LAYAIGALSRKALDGALYDAWELKANGKRVRQLSVSISHRLMEELKTTRADSDPSLAMEA
jgi:hypothetical protein